ncbi:beta-ribofuranosylaminobenzene 5'-phosphate synthase family protein [Thermococcus waiotapuensis]|uniref:Beta-ribofuranosylaminobenzene 5'-phosphate synthase n=1 Tax=Thermococcus waiotapuensis TaxID=90909 RepID=A0AAE4NUQ3_9EURY|nr:beta-ribofuranosylaminobenzene 5'-phosphate synthase family protein [Thermococcus waiotapuensis]MDV3103676.1 GHMP kinase [Thermococcus waiotapuensis]
MIIRTPKRLHLGLIDPSGGLGRRFGAIGVALEGGYEIKVSPGDGLKINASGKDEDTIREAVARMNHSFGTGTGYSIEVVKAIPRHVGLGSTTQLSLAVGMAIAKLNGLNISVEELARALGRGKNSGAGIYTFKLGGLVVDGGVKDDVPPLVVRHEFPESWAFLLIIPDLKPGFDEREEEPVMKSAQGDPGVAREISHILLLGLLPALVEKNIEAFGRHLTEIQRLVGRHFGSQQGGEFREDLKPIIDFLAEKTYGYGQSSWGPTVYGLIPREEGERLIGEAEDYLREHGLRGRVELGVPRNSGAEVVNQNVFLERLIKSVSSG